ncbi:hypothetical protein MMC12_003019 [Toensbergia leucococca]|nr:hypothetical protein [Toensbergia leucococca]
MSNPQFVRMTVSGVGIYVRIHSQAKGFYRLPIRQEFLEGLGTRVEDEFEGYASKHPLVREKTARIIIESNWHKSPEDPVKHSTVSCEDVNESFVENEPMHVAEDPSEQSKSDANKKTQAGAKW